jgi:hypothetical protein
VVQEESNKIYFVIFEHSYKFLQILEVWTNFYNYLSKIEKEKDSTVHGPNPAHGYRPLVVAACHARPAKTAAAWRLGPAGETACAARGNARAGVVTTRRLRAEWRGGALAGSSAVAKWR